jgi:hypothetical protein
LRTSTPRPLRPRDPGGDEPARGLARSDARFGRQRLATAMTRADSSLQAAPTTSQSSKSSSTTRMPKRSSIRRRKPRSAPSRCRFARTSMASLYPALWASRAGAGDGRNRSRRLGLFRNSRIVARSFARTSAAARISSSRALNAQSLYRAVFQQRVRDSSDVEGNGDARAPLADTSTRASERGARAQGPAPVSKVLSWPSGTAAFSARAASLSPEAIRAWRRRAPSCSRTVLVSAMSTSTLPNNSLPTPQPERWRLPHVTGSIGDRQV